MNEPTNGPARSAHPVTFDLDAELEAMDLRPFVLRWRGTDYEALLSLPQFVKYFKRFLALQPAEEDSDEARGGDVEEFFRLAMDLFGECGLPTEVLETQPAAVTLKLVTRFFAEQSAALGIAGSGLAEEADRLESASRSTPSTWQSSDSSAATATEPPA